MFSKQLKLFEDRLNIYLIFVVFFKKSEKYSSEEIVSNLKFVPQEDKFDSFKD